MAYGHAERNLALIRQLEAEVRQLLDSRNEQEDVRYETQLAGDRSDESDWAQNYEQEEEIQHVIATDDR